ncbi:F-box protein SKIP19-like [Humulus lupulus]|uniref:F-box protein SKIP19-like n=1 Tax=Humulus lupulus TaxID=3486 RepID=UPI002B41187E|nr:F-box protein SKIP19-like [Humulus lupulus]
MASSSTEPSLPKEIRNWLELPRDVTASILSRLGTIETMKSGQMVCKSWFDICKDPLMWRIIDMRNRGDRDLGFDLEKMCRNVVDRSCGQLVDINIEHFGDDELLQHITASSSRIKRLRFACWYYVSDEGLVEAIEKLPLLEELDLTHCKFSEGFIEALGRSCPHFKTLKLNTQAYKFSDMDPDEEHDFNMDVIAIGKNLPGLRHLQLIGSWMTNMGLEAILDGCRNLESLDLRRCLNINLKGSLGKRCAEQIKLLRLPYDSLKDYGYIADPDPGFFGEDEDFPFSDHEYFFGDHLELEDDIYDHYDYAYSSEDFDYDDFTAFNEFVSFKDDYDFF